MFKSWFKHLFNFQHSADIQWHSFLTPSLEPRRNTSHLIEKFLAIYLSINHFKHSLKGKIRVYSDPKQLTYKQRAVDAAC